MTKRTRVDGPRFVTASILGVAGVAHFALPAAFDQIVPRWMPGPPRLTTYVSGATELGVAALLLRRRSQRLGGLLAMATFIVVFPANVQSALDGGIAGVPPPFDSPLVAWLRLPLQIPLIWVAWRAARPRDER